MSQSHRIKGGLTAVILAGGLGIRLRPAFAQGPKVLAPVGERPFITHLLDKLEGAGIRRVVLCTGYMAAAVSTALGDRYGGLVLVHSPESAPLGTGGALRHALALLESDPVLVVNGDSWCDLHLPTLLAWHRAHRAEGSIWLVPVGNAKSFARVKLDASGAVAAFREKAGDGPAWVSAGAYLLSHRLLQSITPGTAVSLEREVFPRWVRKGLFGCRAGRALLDIGTPDSYGSAAAQLAALRQRPPAARNSRRMVLLDRDGTVCVERGYVDDPDQIELLPGAAAGLRKLRMLGMGLILVTNQSAVGRGYLTFQQLDRIHSRLKEMLRAESVAFDAIYVCPHRPDEGCECRKPAPGMVLTAVRELAFEPRACFVIGDKPSDVELATGIGATSLLVTTGYGQETLAQRQTEADYAVDSLMEAAEVIDHLTSVEALGTRREDEELCLFSNERGRLWAR